MTDKHKKHHEKEVPLEQELEGEILEEAQAEQTLEQERDDLLARLQRLAADYQNYQKRMQKELSTAREFANESLIKDLLAVLDDMERAMDAANGGDENDPFYVGMKMVHDNLLTILARYGLEKIVAVGEHFDPEKHAAMMQQPSDETEPMTVLQELQKGYTLKGRTIRPAGVIVSKAPE